MNPIHTFIFLCFWKLSIVLFSFKRTRFQRLQTNFINDPHTWGLAPTSTHYFTAVRIEVITKEIISLYGIKWLHTSATWVAHESGEMSKLGRLIEWSAWDMWADPYIVCMWCLVQSATSSLLSSIFCGLLRLVNFDFSSGSFIRFYLCFLMRTSKGLLVSPMQHLPQSHGILYTHCFDYWASLSGTVFSSISHGMYV
jgi:hypothetical protein